MRTNLLFLFWTSIHFDYFYRNDVNSLKNKFFWLLCKPLLQLPSHFHRSESVVFNVSENSIIRGCQVQAVKWMVKLHDTANSNDGLCFNDLFQTAPIEISISSTLLFPKKWQLQVALIIDLHFGLFSPLKLLTPKFDFII